MMSSPAIKFDVPVGCRTFTLFPRLPLELRHRIWQAYLGSEQGANFVKFHVADEGHEQALRPDQLDSPDNAADEPDDVIRLLMQHDAVPRGVVDCILGASYPDPVAEVSHHALLRRRLAIMRSTCKESRTFVHSLLRRSGVLRLDSGTVVSLDRSPDLLILDYYPQELYRRNDTLDVDLYCPRLDTVRRLAVRFCPTWRPETILERMCSCGKHREVDAGNYPTHLYQFLARNLPNLREFYLIDYFIVPKEGEEIKCLDRADSRTSHVFRSRDRIFHDVAHCHPSTGTWKINPKSGKILDWLRDHYVRYASQSTTSRHETPLQVYFGLLACEWKISSPTARRPRTPHGRGRGTRFSEKHVEDRKQSPAMRQAPTGSASRSPSGGPEAMDTGPDGGAERSGTQAASGLSSSVFVFGSGCGDGYEFTFSQPYEVSV
ncbi:hypothetical protein L249_3186 [Ophiocordyceps polyrhachis-furcata BCC 54312]|uniref:2EXR domain-containing protein n=1 Tax=Ophiocordyceps polyrhachis-furcata BCC 54312 TaxID=1330021 RepID=A0A367LPA3_9HYPO|nr:hypothetical protein L249_3186 [Ophiocordyceps polyrhachis-furcata BCC 54312]